MLKMYLTVVENTCWATYKNPTVQTKRVDHHEAEATATEPKNLNKASMWRWNAITNDNLFYV